MKSILYVGATLMIGASIYGFVDYKKTSRNKEFTSMYKEKEVTEAVAIVAKEKTEPAVKKEIASKEKTAVTKKTVTNTDQPIVSIKPIADAERIVTAETKAIETPSVNVSVSKTSTIEKKRRKFSTKLFSRGALDERYIEPKEKINVSKKEVKKTENKEQ